MNKVTWYQVYTKDKVYGFKANETTILDHPDRFWIGKTLQDLKLAIGSLGIKQVSKIADICE